MSHWDKQAKLWQLIGAPLKPSSEDIQNYTQWIEDEFNVHRETLSVLLLGVTPEIINLSWPKQTQLFAMDSNDSMIKNVFASQKLLNKKHPILCQWLKLPIASSSIDLVIGDGCYSSLAFCDYSLLTNEVFRILKKSGLFVMRFFTNVNRKESIDEIKQQLFNDSAQNFHALKLRLAMAMTDDKHHGVGLKHIWDYWASHFKKIVYDNRERLCWSEATINTINNYETSETFYTFPRLNDVLPKIHEQFYETGRFTPTYFLGDRCASFKFKPR